MSEEIVYRPEATTDDVRLGAITVASPHDVIARATEIARELANVVRTCHLAVKIGGAEYVRVEGWTVLGAMLGVMVRERACVRLDDGSYEATVDLVRAADGVVVGSASAVCGIDEPTWAKRPEFARRSMAITRAAGKAFRLAFSWVMSLAGYAPTPAEEVEAVVEHAEGQAAPNPQARPAPRVRPAGATDAMTEFWTYAKAKRLPDEEARAYLKAANGDAAKALEDLKKMYP